MTTPDHAAIALDLIDGWDEHPKLTLEQRIALAQVHATLALVEATGKERARSLFPRVIYNA